VVVSIHPEVLGTSLTQVTVMLPPHPSEVTTLLISGAGTTGLQPGSGRAAGQVIVGGVTSTVLVIVCTQDAVFPLTSVAI
jgi:hypothetical protein